jgi:hypothetical protein
VYGGFHVEDENYYWRDKQDLAIPLSASRGTRGYVHMEVYYLNPTDALPMREEIIGIAKAWYYYADRLIVLGECSLVRSLRQTLIQHDPLLVQLWTSFEDFLRQRYPEATRIVTPSYPTTDEDYHAFLRDRGYHWYNAQAFLKALRPKYPSGAWRRLSTYSKEMPMHVDLTTLKPNPLRDFQVDPIDPEAVARLKLSIAEHGFWGGVVCRQTPTGDVEVAAGHHRVQAAIEAGVTHADLMVRTDIDDEEMVRIYATENGLQRGGQSTAAAGMVLSAVRVLAKRRLHNMAHGSVSHDELRAIHGNFTKGNGIGEPDIYAFLHHTLPGQDKERLPAMTHAAIREQLLNLKASGDYGRVMHAAVTEVLGDEQTTIALPAQPKEFDFEGVAKHLKNTHQIRAFREVVTSKGIKPHLPVEEQAALAAHVIDTAKREGITEVTGTYVREEVVHVKLQNFYAVREHAKAEHEALMKADVIQRAEFYMREFRRHARQMGSIGLKFSELFQDWPKGLEFPMTAAFVEDMRHMSELMQQIDRTLRTRLH